MIVEKLDEVGELQTKEILRLYEDAYTSELLVLHACLMKKSEIKISLSDAKQDRQIFDSMNRGWAASSAKILRTASESDGLTNGLKEGVGH